MALSLAAGAQTSSGDAKPQDIDRLQKQADAVFRWIKIQTDRPAPAPAKPAPAPAAAKRPAPPPAATATANRAAPVASEPSEAAAQTAEVRAEARPEPRADATPVAAESSAEPRAEPGAAVTVAAAPASPEPSAAMQTATQAGAPASAAEPDEDMPLQLISKVDPTIPRTLRKTLSSGYAQVRFTVAPDGKISQASPLKATHYRLAQLAVDAVKQWRFAPIKHAQEAAVEINFNLEE